MTDAEARKCGGCKAILTYNIITVRMKPTPAISTELEVLDAASAIVTKPTMTMMTKMSHKPVLTH